MKKFVTVILSVLLVFIFCSCGNSENNNTVLPENTDYDLKSVFVPAAFRIQNTNSGPIPKPLKPIAITAKLRMKNTTTKTNSA